MMNRDKIKNFLDQAIDALLPLAAVPFALLIGAALLLFFKVNPLEAYQSLFLGAFGDKTGITQTLVKATPLLLVGLGVAIAFRGGVINIGGEGQVIVGALAATAFSIALRQLPGWILIPSTILVGTLAGSA
jgi:simple sugar transport system permease protein